MCRFGGRNLQQRELLPIFTAFPFNRPGPGASFGEPLHGKGTLLSAGSKRSGGIFPRNAPRRSAQRTVPTTMRPFSGRRRRDFGTRFVLISVNCGTATAVRFLHLFKFGLVVLGGQPPGAAGNREIPCCFCVRMRGGRGRPRRFRVRRVRKSRPVFRSVLCGAPAADFTGRQCAPARKLCGGR